VVDAEALLRMGLADSVRVVVDDLVDLRRTRHLMLHLRPMEREALAAGAEDQEAGAVPVEGFRSCAVAPGIIRQLLCASPLDTATTARHCESVM